MTYRPVPRYGKQPDLGWGSPPGCWRNPAEPHGVGHNAVCVCGCAWCEEERAALRTQPAQGDLFADGGLRGETISAIISPYELPCNGNA